MVKNKLVKRFHLLPPPPLPHPDKILAVNDKNHKRRYTSKRSVCPGKECAESGDENEADDEYSNHKKSNRKKND